MNILTALLRALHNWSVERKMIIMLFIGIVMFPLAAFILLQSRGVGETTNFLIGLIVVSIILLVPFAKWMSHVLALHSIRELNDQCRQLKEGNYSGIDLPPAGTEEHDFQELKRNMHWMGYTIATRESKLQKAMADLSVAQRQIGESLEYASLIQTSFLPRREDLYDYIPDHFLTWDQRDVVGGDAYWFKSTSTGFFVGVIDCTGHGVPGAFMTLIVISLLDKATADATSSPAEVLGRMNRLIKGALGQNDRDAKSDDGMDCVLCHVSREEGRVVFAGANSPLIVSSAQGCVRIKADRCGLGYVRSSRNYEFTDHEINVEAGMRFYLASDGLVDQVGGKSGFPFGKSRFMEFIGQNRSMPIAGQGRMLASVLKEFQGGETRRDDITVIGFEL